MGHHHAASLTSARIVFEFGHNRWRIENDGFNELVAHWHSRHVFHHHANSMLVLWLIMFITHAVFHCFMRNLQPALRKAHTVIHHAASISASSMRTIDGLAARLNPFGAA